MVGGKRKRSRNARGGKRRVPSLVSLALAFGYLYMLTAVAGLQLPVWGKVRDDEGKRESRWRDIEGEREADTG